MHDARTKIGRDVAHFTLYEKHADASSATAYNAFFFTSWAKNKNFNVFFNGYYYKITKERKIYT